MSFWKKRKPKLAPPTTGPDFSDVDSLAKAQKLCADGTLEKLYLMPLDFGGQDIPPNILYVPVGIADIKHGIDTNVIGPLAADGSITQYAAEPEYRGDSFIPMAINIRAWEPREFNTQINIWGEALEREDQM
ncbi:hypothetical protein Poly51_40350 [Rubripirellula tenax]|uniref:Uncharacterized protein n=1 Tax=Rubripirellula tenax TaxID=2528015 RepID=A0A5C6ENW1_9BACT|nr:hypothetical protein [Rubripirellula tenax]TWU50742.1 hypothetical protein Poly51_40350 [Rubripirellula tenax]